MWKTIIYWIGVAYIAIKATIDFLGNADFLITKSQDPGWLGDMWNYIIIPTPQINFVLILIVLSITIWAKYPAIKNRFFTTPAPKISPLKIEFDGTDVRKIQEPHPTFQSDQVTRRFYGVRVRNDGPENINNVSLEVEKIEQIPDRADEIVPVPSHLGLKFRFKLSDKPMQDFSPQLSDRVPLISHVKAILLSHVFKMASTQKYEFPHNNRRHRIHVKVTGSGVPHVSRTFIVWADGDGDMKMTGE